MAKPTEPESMELPLVALPGVHPCNECGDCCTYIAVEIDNPTTFTDLENVYWYLVHKGVAVYIDFDGDWFIEFRTVCEHLSDAKTCGVYEERPKICSEFSWNDCEKTSGERAWKYHFDKPEQFLAWLEEKQPQRFAKYQKSRQKLIAKREAERAAEKAGAGVSSAAAEVVANP